MRIIARLSGDHSTLAVYELTSLFDLYGIKYSSIKRTGVFLSARLGGTGEKRLGGVLKRAGLTLAAGVVHPYEESSGKVEVWRVKEKVGVDEARKRIKEFREELRKRGVEVTLTGRGRGEGAIYLAGDEIHYVKLLFKRGGDILKRSNTFRPFRKPISIDPRLARASVNLLAIPPGGVFLDPFCGTGGIGIEAALLGYRTYIADADPDMVEGSLLNFRSLSLLPHFHTNSEVRDLPQHLPSPADGIATDPPYGRSSRSFGRPVEDLLTNLDKLLNRGGKVLLILHREEDADRLEDQYRVLKRYKEKVHRSLTRHYILFNLD